MKLFEGTTWKYGFDPAMRIPIDDKSVFAQPLRSEVGRHESWTRWGDLRPRLTVSKAKAVAAVITPANQSEWIHMAATLSRDKLEREVAKVSPYSPKAERAKPVGTDKFLVTFELSLEEMKEFRRAQEIVSQKSKSASTQRATIVDLVNCFLKHHDPVEKADRVTAKRAQAKPQVPTPMRHAPVGGSKINKPMSPAKSKAIPASIRHAVFTRDRGECQAQMPTGEKCL